MPFTLDADQAAMALEDRGYDVSRESAETEEDRGVVNLIAGRLDEGSPRQVWLDAGGSLRMQITRQTNEGATERVVHNGRQYKISRETQSITNIWVTLASIDEIDAALDDLEDMARQPSQEPNPPATFPTKEGGAKSDAPPSIEEEMGEGSSLPSYEASTDLAPPLAAEALTDKGETLADSMNLHPAFSRGQALRGADARSKRRRRRRRRR